MRLQESRAKGILSAAGIAVPEGYVVRRPEEVQEVPYPMMVKAQVPVGGRGKAGGVIAVRSLAEAREAVRSILGMAISGHVVRSVLVERMVEGERELYLSLAIDRTTRLPLLMASRAGGMDIESVSDGDIGKWTVHPFMGVEDHLVREVASHLDIDRTRAGRLLRSVWATFEGMDCELVEINPLMVVGSGELVAADAKIIINDDALFRHPEVGPGEEDLTPLERDAREMGISFVQLPGDIGVIANGAGLTMATLDELALFGGRGGAFLDLGGTDDPGKVQEAFGLVVRAHPKVILLNIFGGITKCDTVARGVVQAASALGVRIPIVARIRGVNEEEARAILQEAGIAALTDLGEAARRAVELEAGR